MAASSPIEKELALNGPIYSALGVGAPALAALLGGAYGGGSGGLEGGIRGAGQGLIRGGGVGLGALAGVLAGRSLAGNGGISLAPGKVNLVGVLGGGAGAAIGDLITSSMFEDSNKSRDLAAKHKLMKLMANDAKYEDEKTAADFKDTITGWGNKAKEIGNNTLAEIKNMFAQNPDPGFAGNALGSIVPDEAKNFITSYTGPSGYNRLLRSGGHAGIGAALGMGAGALHGLVNPSDKKRRIRSMIMDALGGGAVGGLAGGVVGAVDPLADAAQSAVSSVGGLFKGASTKNTGGLVEVAIRALRTTGLG